MLTTIRFHGRSRVVVSARYDRITHHHAARIAAGLDALALDGFQETMYWLPGPAALVPGDLLIGDGEGGVRMCPESWLRGYMPPGLGVADLREALLPLLELPVEHVLLSHWSVVIGGGHAALERALA